MSMNAYKQYTYVYTKNTFKRIKLSKKHVLLEQTKILSVLSRTMLLV